MEVPRLRRVPGRGCRLQVCGVKVAEPAEVFAAAVTFRQKRARHDPCTIQDPCKQFIEIIKTENWLMNVRTIHARMLSYTRPLIVME